MGRYDLHLSEDEFWNITPRQFDILIKRYIVSEERADRRVALLAYLSASANKKKSAKFKMEDFMLHDFRGKKKARTDPMSQLAILKHKFGKPKA